LCSIERLDDSRGYVLGNVAIICHELNVTAKWSIRKVKLVQQMVLTPVDCSAIEKMKAKTEAPSKDCPLHCFISKMLKRARTNTVQRAKRRHNGDLLCPVTIDTDWIYERFLSQQGRCSISGIPMSLHPHSDWRCSLERLDNSKGYSPENTTLVCLEFNGPRQWNPAKFKIFQSFISGQTAVHANLTACKEDKDDS
jgi:hypothetical protein